MGSALNGSSLLQHFECGNAVKVRNEITFNFYPGLPHMLENFFREELSPKTTELKYDILFLSFIVADTPDGTVFFNHDKLLSPATKDEIVEIVKLAAQNGRKIRVLGSGHSRSPLALSEDIMVSLHQFKGLVEVDLESKQVTVRAGTTLQELNGILEEKGLALTNMPAIADPTVAGAIATGKDNVHIWT